jgi:hypothetical protein
VKHERPRKGTDWNRGFADDWRLGFSGHGVDRKTVSVENSPIGINLQKIEIKLGEVETLKSLKGLLSGVRGKAINLGAKTPARQILQPFQGPRRKFAGTERRWLTHGDVRETFQRRRAEKQQQGPTPDLKIHNRETFQTDLRWDNLLSAMPYNGTHALVSFDL